MVNPKPVAMGRWRPPAVMPSAYITAEGFAALQLELKDIWKRRADVVKALTAAAAEGDRSENAEYIYRKKELGGLDRRIRYIQKRLPTLKVVESPGNIEKVYFGAWVELATEEGDHVTYRIVGADETDAKRGFISLDSPMSALLLGKAVDDEVRLVLKGGAQVFEIISIRYHE